MAPFMPFDPSVSTSSAPRGERLAPFDRHGLGHGEDQLVALGRGGKGERNAGIAGSGLDQRGFSGVILPLSFQRLDHGDADAVLDAGYRVEEFELGQQIGDGPLLRRSSLTSGVSPIVSVMELKTRPRPGTCVDVTGFLIALSLTFESNTRG